MVFCQSLPGGVVAIGWTCRAMQREAVRCWWKRRPGREPRESFREFAWADPALRKYASWPNWIVAPLDEPRSESSSWLGWFFSSLRGNLTIGAQAIVNTWTLTLPACVLWYFGWFFGWDNSFNKGYEQSFVGAGIALTGVAVFIAAMLYLPIAQARQAVSGEWRSFFDYRVVRSVISRCRVRWLFLTAGYALASLPVTLLILTPFFATHGSGALVDLSVAQHLEWLESFYFWNAAIVLALYIGLRVAATRIYALGLLKSLESGQIGAEALRETEKRALAALELLPAAPIAASDHRSRAGRRLSGAGMVATVALAVVLWMAFVAQIFIGQFLNYRSAQGWLNQPLVQVPWIRNIPTPVAE